MQNNQKSKLVETSSSDIRIYPYTDRVLEKRELIQKTFNINNNDYEVIFETKYVNGEIISERPRSKDLKRIAEDSGLPLRKIRKLISLVMQNKQKSKLVPGIGRVPFPAYRGQGRYIFVSYAHADSHLVFPEIIRFQELGYNIWYDEEITPGNEWKQHITDRLMHCDLFIIFITNRSVNSKNCRKEFYCALNNDKRIIPFFIDDFDSIEIDAEWKADLSEIQGILMKNYDDEESYIFKFSEAFRNFGFEIFNFSNSVTEKILYESDLNSNMKLIDIQQLCDKFFDEIYVCDNRIQETFVSLFKSIVDMFIDSPGQYFADEIYSNFIGLYELILKKSTEDFLNANQLRYFYNTLKKYDETQSRQNFVHSVNVFILGLAIYSQNEKYRMHFSDYLANNGFSNSQITIHVEFFIRWGMASLFHDSCFIIETSEKKVKNNIFKELRQFLNYDTDNLMGGINGFNMLLKHPNDLISQQISENVDIDAGRPTDILALKIAHDLRMDNDNMGRLKNSLNFFLNYAYDNDFDEHAISASIMLLNCFSLLNNNQSHPDTHFFNSILDSASAILLHNYYHYVLQEDPFDFDRLKVSEIPLAYLLILCDEIMETSVDSISFEISDGLYLKYNLESSSRGFGFHDKESLLNNILDISEIFDRKFTIVKSVNPNSFFEIKKRDFENRYVDPPVEMVERIAHSIHLDFVETTSHRDNFAENLNRIIQFDELPLRHQRANINEGKQICKRLQFHRYEIVKMDDIREGITDFSEDELMDLAMLSHYDWRDEKIATLPSFDSIEFAEKYLSQVLAPWDGLRLDEQQIDIESVRRIPFLLSRIGLKVVKSKINLLTLELYDYICEFIGVETPFEALEHHLQDLHHQKTNLIVESLFEINYKIVDKNDLGEPITHLSDREIGYVAAHVHREYLKTLINLGLEVNNYLEDGIDIQTGNCTERMNYRLITSLTILCNNVGLKIVKLN